MLLIQLQFILGVFKQVIAILVHDFILLESLLNLRRLVILEVGPSPLNHSTTLPTASGISSG
jgi:hypothetical protein